ncbi:histidine kinase dimerization/phosphoacceptor domain -containing protein [Bradyrhizobium yuanmingense]|uniref:histidine kinase dimerization/phosphoacceptor domain -containing protein n=1 Tax=Bradyrhizobium yuanmingense TaxID=108015 RepID=UPI00351574A5
MSRTTLQKLSEANRYSEILLQELAHRTRNDLATIVSVLRLQARSATGPAVQSAIASAVSRWTWSPRFTTVCATQLMKSLTKTPLSYPPFRDNNRLSCLRREGNDRDRA